MEQEIDRITQVPPPAGLDPFKTDDGVHGYYVAAFAGGSTMGVAPKADLFYAPVDDADNRAQSSSLQTLISIANHAKDRPKNSAVVVMSYGVRIARTPQNLQLRATMGRYHLAPISPCPCLTDNTFKLRLTC